ncbi:MAG: NAD(P)H-dependent oxidoreductase [Vagococcus sp.]|uniref:NADPH-dependent FMN reductase n=1 Tax=Vagococcus sp. TaxID=1933889 RepID=UPI002FC92F27
MTKKIGIIVGSTRKSSYNRSIADSVATLFPDKFDVVFPEIGHLEMFDQDYDDEGRTPESWKQFREEIKSLDGVIFVTPEHNRSVPSVLKNALDVASRPYGENAWNDKPGAIITASPGAISGFGANHHLRQVIAFLNVQTMAQPEAYLGSVMNYINEDGSVKEDTVKFLQMVVDAYVAWFERLEK